MYQNEWIKGNCNFLFHNQKKVNWLILTFLLYFYVYITILNCILQFRLFVLYFYVYITQFWVIFRNSGFFLRILSLHLTILFFVTTTEQKILIFVLTIQRLYLTILMFLIGIVSLYLSKKTKTNWDITNIQTKEIKVTIVHSLADMGFQTLLTLIELTKKKTPRHFSKYLLLCSNISKTVTISQTQISSIMMIARQQANKAHLVGIVFLNNAISVSIYIQRYLCKRTETTWGSHQHEAVYSYSTDTVYIIHKHRRRNEYIWDVPTAVRCRTASPSDSVFSP